MLEELIVRRELAINFVARNPDYDRLAGCPEWARKTLADTRPRPPARPLHGRRARGRRDPRPALERGPEGDGADRPDAQLSAHVLGQEDPRMDAGRRDGVSRSRSISTTATRWTAATPTATPGVAWAIGGKHDRPWPERPIFGTVRFMSYESTRKKFDSAAYMRVRAIEQGR